VNTDRRAFVRTLGLSGLFWTVPGAFAEQLSLTPRQTEGPFYPDRLPLDTDNDLIVVNNAITPAVGEITHLSGRILTANGSPVRNVVVEIWQVDRNGCYLHSGSNNKDKQDKNFQGFGRFETNGKGEYRFRTIKPVAYDNRTPHIHFAINRGSERLLTTQLYIKGEPRNESDGIYRRTSDKDRQLLSTDFLPMRGSKTGEVAAKWDIVIGMTPEDIKTDPFRQRRS
jgi:protocatechuate 3,4-dioxygenase beta subunit